MQYTFEDSYLTIILLPTWLKMVVKMLVLIPFFLQELYNQRDIYIAGELDKKTLTTLSNHEVIDIFKV